MEKRKAPIRVSINRQRYKQPLSFFVWILLTLLIVEFSAITYSEYNEAPTTQEIQNLQAPQIQSSLTGHASNDANLQTQGGGCNIPQIGAPEPPNPNDPNTFDPNKNIVRIIYEQVTWSEKVGDPTPETSNNWESDANTLAGMAGAPQYTGTNLQETIGTINGFWESFNLQKQNSSNCIPNPHWDCEYGCCAWVEGCSITNILVNNKKERSYNTGSAGYGARSCAGGPSGSGTNFYKGNSGIKIWRTECLESCTIGDERCAKSEEVIAGVKLMMDEVEKCGSSYIGSCGEWSTKELCGLDKICKEWLGQDGLTKAECTKNNGCRYDYDPDFPSAPDHCQKELPYCNLIDYPYGKCEECGPGERLAFKKNNPNDFTPNKFCIMKIYGSYNAEIILPSLPIYCIKHGAEASGELTLGPDTNIEDIPEVLINGFISTYPDKAKILDAKIAKDKNQEEVIKKWLFPDCPSPPKTLKDILRMALTDTLSSGKRSFASQIGLCSIYSKGGEPIIPGEKMYFQLFGEDSVKCMSFDAIQALPPPNSHVFDGMITDINNMMNSVTNALTLQKDPNAPKEKKPFFLKGIGPLIGGIMGGNKPTTTKTYTPKKGIKSVYMLKGENTLQNGTANEFFLSSLIFFGPHNTALAKSPDISIMPQAMQNYYITNLTNIYLYHVESDSDADGVQDPLSSTNNPSPYENLALGKPAYQSTDPYGWPASRAVDGDVNTAMHTGSNAGEWWYVDLQAVYALSKFELVKRAGFPGRPNYYKIQVSNTGSFSGEEITMVDQSSLPCNEATCTHPITPTSGRYVRVLNTGGDAFLNIAEFRVYSSPVQEKSDLCPNTQGRDVAMKFIGPEGGNLTTPSESAALIIPKDAVSQNTLFQIADNNPYFVHVDSSGCSIEDFDFDGVRDDFDNCRFTPNSLQENREGTEYSEGCAALGMVSYWKANEDIIDSYGSNNGVANATAFINGKVGQAFNFNGSSYVNLGDKGNLNLRLGDMTISAWIKTNIISNQTIYSKGANGGYQSGYALIEEGDSGKAVLVFSDNGALHTIHSDNSIADGTWHHLVGVVDRSGGLELYVDSIKQTGEIDSYSVYIGAHSNMDIYPGTLDACIGASCSIAGLPALTNYFTGQIDEVAIFNKALTETEVSEIYVQSLIGEDSCEIACTDNDNDGYGSDAVSTCRYPRIADCNDHNQAINPGVQEVCPLNKIDDNCDGCMDGNSQITEKITNGEFNSGSSGWAKASHEIAPALIAPLGGRDNVAVDNGDLSGLSQKIQVTEVSLSSAVLSFDDYMGGASGTHRFDVGFLDINDNVLGTIEVWHTTAGSPPPANSPTFHAYDAKGFSNSWESHTIDINNELNNYLYGVNRSKVKSLLVDFYFRYGSPGPSGYDNISLMSKSCTPLVCSAVCGNRIIESGETCDDGNDDNEDSCINCQLTNLPIGCPEGTLEWPGRELCIKTITPKSYCPALGAGWRRATGYDIGCNTLTPPNLGYCNVQPGNHLVTLGEYSFIINNLCAGGLCSQGYINADGFQFENDGWTINYIDYQMTHTLCVHDIGDVLPIQIACGNGFVESGETCDDGNLADGDGCSSTCQFEPTTDSLGDACDPCPGNPLNNCEAAKTWLYKKPTSPLISPENTYKYSGFISEYGTTDFDQITNFQSVSGLVLGNPNGKLRWLKPLNLSANILIPGFELDSLISIENKLVKFDTEPLDETFNSSVEVTLNNINCYQDFSVYYNSSERAFFEKSLLTGENPQTGVVCNSKSKPSCSKMTCRNGILTFTISSLPAPLDILQTEATAQSEIGISEINWINTYPITAEELAKGYKKQLSKMERVGFILGGEAHHVGVIEVTSTKATIEVLSTPQIADLEIGETKNFEVTGDNYFDIAVNLDNISGENATLIITSIHQQMTAEEIAARAAEIALATGAMQAPVYKTSKFWVILVIILAIIGATIYYMRQKNKLPHFR